MPLVLAIVDPGCESKGASELERRAEQLLEPHSGRWAESQSGEHHHAGGWRYPFAEFETIRGLYRYWEPGVRPTTKPLDRASGYGDGNDCVACNGTGLIPFACARNACPLCGGLGVDVGEHHNPNIFPLSLMDPSLSPWAIVTPDGRWQCCDRPVRWWRADWTSHVREVAAYFRHCYGVCLGVKY